MRGRRPTSESLQALGEQSLANRMVSGEPPACPDWLDDIAKEEWARLVPALAQIGLAHDVDVALLSSYCKSYSQWRKMVETVSTEGAVLINAKGTAYRNPADIVAEHAAAEMRRIAQEFGFSPAARCRVKNTKQTAGQSELAEFLSSA